MSTRKISLRVLAAVATVTLFATAPANAAPTCGEVYRVKSGDSLSEIAKAAYGSPREFRTIYSANSAVIGSNPALIEVGMRLEIPCLDGAVAASTANTDAIKVAKTTEALPAPSARTIRFVTATDWAPFTNQDQEQGGMIVEIANVAMENAVGKPDYKIDFVNDWSAHLQPLISDHAYDFSLVWFRPNCDIVERLGDGSKFRCNNLSWSEPLFEQIIGYYTRSNGLRPVAHKDLLGATICRPSGFSIFMLEEHNLVEPTAKLVRAGSSDECFQGLASGEYDAVAMAADVAEGSIEALGLKDQVYFNEGLSQVVTMHAVISNTHPLRDEYLNTLNSGVLKIKDSGEWFSIVRRHMTAHRQKTQS